MKRSKLLETSLDKGIVPAEPLWKRVPVRDANGKPFSDFMMIIPKLCARPPEIIKDIIKKIEAVLACYGHHIVFADLNLKLNILWVSIKPVPGLVLEVATAINYHVPEAKLVAQQIPRKPGS